MEVKKKYSDKVVSIKRTKLKCPTCKNKSSDSLSPFCSKKCADQDLMKWLSDEQSINIKID